jgi:hypothetical protein
MGMPFAIGTGAASRRAGAPTAFLWGVNGAMSVVASVLGALCAMLFGIDVTFGAGFVTCAVAAVALVLIGRRSLPPEPAPDEPDPEERVPVTGPDIVVSGAGEHEPAPDAVDEREPALGQR